MLLRAWALRDRLTARLPLGYLDVQPGDRFRPPGVAGDWIAEEVDIERLIVTVSLRPAWDHAGSRSADPGRGNPQTDVVAEPTRLALFDLPDPETSQPTLALAAASPTGTAGSVPIEIGAAGTFTASRSAAREAVLGKAAAILGVGQAALFDMVNMIEVELVNPDHWLQSRDDAALAMGANLAAVGDELIQFADAEAISPGRFRLSKLLRGRRGSEWAMNVHAADEAFVLLDARSIKAIPLPAEMLGLPVMVIAHGPSDGGDAPSVSRVANGEAMRPLSPAHVSARLNADGSLALGWIRRTRLAWGWQDEVEAPADQTLQGFRVRVAGAGGLIERDVTENFAVIDGLELSALGAGSFAIEVRQIGVLALSRPAAITFNL